MSAALAMLITPVHELLIDAQEEGERRWLILITDGRDLKYTLPHAIPPGWTRFAMKVKPRLLEVRPKEPRS